MDSWIAIFKEFENKQCMSTLSDVPDYCNFFGGIDRLKCVIFQSMPPIINASTLIDPISGRPVYRLLSSDRDLVIGIMIETCRIKIRTSPNQKAFFVQMDRSPAITQEKTMAVKTQLSFQLSDRFSFSVTAIVAIIIMLAIIHSLNVDSSLMINHLYRAMHASYDSQAACAPWKSVNAVPAYPTPRVIFDVIDIGIPTCDLTA